MTQTPTEAPLVRRRNVATVEPGKDEKTWDWRFGASQSCLPAQWCESWSQLQWCWYNSLYRCRPQIAKASKTTKKRGFTAWASTFAPTQWIIHLANTRVANKEEFEKIVVLACMHNGRGGQCAIMKSVWKSFGSRDEREQRWAASMPALLARGLPGRHIYTYINWI